MKVSLVVAALLSLLAAPLRSAPLAIPDVALFDQNGKSVRFYSDLVKGKVVAMNFVFTSCTTICAPMGANFGALQAKLGNRKDVALISVSIDPSMHVLLSSVKRNVWWRFMLSSSYRRSASLLLMRSPVYSRMRVPFRMRRSANTPRPWISELRTTYRGSRPFFDIDIGFG